MFLHKEDRVGREEKADRPIGVGLRRNIGSPTALGEAVEHELEAFISRRDKQCRRTEGERGEEVAWRESERREEAARREEVYAVNNTEVLSRAAFATDSQLGAMAELATTTGNDELGRAVFVAAEQRELGDVMHRYLDAMGEDAHEAYEELRAAPSEEAMERKLADAETLFAPPAAQDFAPSLGAAS
jgi:hypothetical protein